ncbi:SDR family NAD(P)-dependent oxidoreductase [Paenibacillus sacheonensis]|uniref:Glucose 1-dehydrogenase n=1 Tax=Paenibacillus sacheonensis TaxID=742054 RepID=A0A7X5C1E1_9BACL|nr:3-oxoacyl-ACP reductase family protein [Paenibacillus sacheonensis]MBM7564800.1 NAD(P)-dependent dehydrogenase (short-subunit alcohol dehydrogenase family) [Paenibacillus sacheonensis]NBC69349.1 glucose 1-dehydrogenase [Paenibacillus sacheonensis]
MQSQHKQLQGRVALVTGSAKGIGSGIVRELAAQGASVCVNYATSAEAAERLIRELHAQGCPAFSYQADIGDPSQASALVAAVVEQFGRIDILVNNAAIDPVIHWASVTETNWDSIMNANLKGTFFASQASARHMQKQGFGRIVNISSVHANTTMHGYAVYAASKGGMNALTRQLALDLAPLGITVNAVAPGLVEVEKHSYDTEEEREYDAVQIPVKRVGVPGDIAPLVAFLASDASSYINGQVFTVDGGSSARFYLKQGPVEAD